MPTPDNKDVPATDRRKKPRFAVSPSFLLDATLSLPDETGEKWKDYPATLVDLSASGAHIQVSLAAVAYPEGRCRLRLTRAKFKLELPGNIAHFVGNARLAVGGMQIYFPDPGVEKAYHRVLEPVMIGASLAPADGSQEYSTRYKEDFSGKLSSRLTVFRDNKESPVCGFDFRMNHYGVEAERAPGDAPEAKMVLKFRETAGGGSAKPLTEGQEMDARWLFRLAVSNLSATVPAEIRKLLQAQG